MASLSSPSVPVIFLCLLLALYGVGSGWYSAQGLENPGALVLIYRAGVLWAVIWWVRSDNRKYGVRLAYCLGVLVSVGWFIVLPHYLYRTRGGGWFIPVLWVMGIWVGAGALTAFAHLLFSQ